MSSALGWPPFVPLLVMRRRVLPAATVLVSWDAEFLAGLIHTADVQLDANANGNTPTPHAGINPNWVPVPTLKGVPCRLMPKRGSSRESDGGARPGATRTWRVLFGRSIALDRRHRLVVIDPDQGRTTYLYVSGESWNAHLQNHHWVADATDYRL